MKFTWLVVFFFSLWSIRGQEITHIVQKSETVTRIAQQYKVTPHAIYQLNPDSEQGIREGQSLRIPSANNRHLIQSGETWFSLSRTYGLSVGELQQANPQVVASGLRTGEYVSIPKGATASSTRLVSGPAVSSQVTPAKRENVVPKAMRHEVKAGESWTSLGRDYGLAVNQLKSQNPSIKDLQVGQILYIVSETRPANVTDSQVQRPEPKVYERTTAASENTEVRKVTTSQGFANYEVKPGETIFSLTRQFGVSEANLIQLNPHIKDGLKSGMILKVPGSGSFRQMLPAGYADLTKSIDPSTQRKLAILLPFNAEKTLKDTTGLANRLQREVFLNMTLDFYAGALMAIDSARSMNLPVNITILDSEESKNTSVVPQLITAHNLKNYHAVIGPFYQNHAEKTAELLAMHNVPVISPLSNKSSKNATDNLFLALPTEDEMKLTTLRYMESKNGNILVISDPKRTSTRMFISAHGISGVQYVPVSETGNVDVVAMKTMLKKDLPNFIVLDTERTGMILATTNALLPETTQYDVQLATLGANETLEFEEISLNRLTLLRLMMPQVAVEMESPEATRFRAAYRKINNVNPSAYAVRGFDVTFDTLLRLSQAMSFQQSALNQKTQHVESKFDYTGSDPESGKSHVNKGIYLIQYQEDMSTKVIN